MEIDCLNASTMMISNSYYIPILTVESGLFQLDFFKSLEEYCELST